MNRLTVAVGVVMDDTGKILVAQRPQGKVCAGQWEFPGGKVEPGESVNDALVRELKEELNIEVLGSRHLFDHTNEFSDRVVDLHVWLVNDWQGIPESLEDQAFRWCWLDEIYEIDFLSGNLAMLSKLAKAIN